MATTIKLKSGSGAPLAGDLVAAEPALDLTNKRLYTENASGTVIEVGTNPTSLTTGTFTSTGIDDNATSTAITIDASENVAIGLPSAVARLEAQGSGTTSSTYSFITRDGNGTARFYVKDDGVSVFAGNVGINIDNPSSALDVRLTGATGDVAELHNNGGFGIRFNVEGNGGTNTIFSESNQSLALGTNGSGNPRVTINSSGNVGIGTTATANTRVYVRTALATDVAYLADNSTNSGFKVKFNSGSTAILNDFNAPLIFGTNDTERMRIDANGSVGIGTTATSSTHRVTIAGAGGDRTQPLEVLGTGTAGPFSWLISGMQQNLGAGQRAAIFVGKSESTNNASAMYHYHAGDGSSSNQLRFGLFGADDLMSLSATGNLGIGTTSPAATLNVSSTYNPTFRLDNPSGPIRFNMYDTATFVGQIAGSTGSGVEISAVGARNIISYTNGAERMRIDSSGDLLVGTTTISVSSSVNGFTASQNGSIQAYRSGNTVAYFNRNTNDGTIVSLRQADVEEGTIAVSGTTVSYNGGHLSRWSQSDINDVSTIYKGTVMSNLDEMCVWTNEDNEQLNKTKISDVEGDVNVAGVFVAEDNSDDLSDYYLAMTGDMIIRIAQGTTVQRGDLLMSAGDGTAKPQDDDIVRSKTIAKVTSTNVTCTYADGSYCVPCVLMAC